MSAASAYALPVLLLLAGGTAAEADEAAPKCSLPPAIFNFGDSNSDTGGFWAAFPAQKGPFGMTFFGRPSGRASDGRLVIDFLAQGLGLGMLSPYLKSIGSDYTGGANFATLASTVLLPNSSLFVSGISPFSLAIQLNQFKALAAAAALPTLSSGVRLPPAAAFAGALYTIDIGQNDFTSNLPLVAAGDTGDLLAAVVQQIAWTVKELYALGGRRFLVFNLAPVGCFPSFLAAAAAAGEQLDAYGCAAAYNGAVVRYNEMLQRRLDELRPALPGAAVAYVDTHSVKLKLFQHPSAHGFIYGTRACCGYGGGEHNFDPKVYCGNSAAGGAAATACSDPWSYVSWDGIHATEAANRVVAAAVMNGSVVHPPMDLFQRCRLSPIA